MFVVTVIFTVRPEAVEAFKAAVLLNAAQSLTEPGCNTFEVSATKDFSQVFLYEVYDDEAAFATHLETEHFRDFDARSESWVNSKLVQQFHLQPVGALK